MFKAFILCVAAFFAFGIACADNQWGNYQWARTTESFDLTVVNSVTPDWDAYVAQATADWSSSVVVNLVEANGNDSKKIRRRCTPPNGKVRICNLTYGNTGWLGIATIYIDSLGHIVKGFVKLNDTYFDQAQYDYYELRQMVTCQELGHELGLDHQDTDFNNESLFSCMDFQIPPFPLPNQHDYDQLELNYAHVDVYDSYSNDVEEPKDPKPCRGRKCNAGLGLSLGRNGQRESFILINDDGTRQVTYVIWAPGF